MTTYTTPDGRVTDADPTGALCVLAGTDLIELDATDRGSCTFGDGQTHRTVVRFHEDGADDLDAGEVPVHSDGQAAVAQLPDFETPDGWRPYWLLPVTAPSRSLAETLADAFSTRPVVLDDPETRRFRYVNRAELAQLVAAALAALGVEASAPLPTSPEGER